MNSDVQNDRVNVDVDLVGRKAKEMVRNKRERKLRLATWNFSGLGSDRKQKEIGELLAKHNLDVAGQESWEKEETRIDVEGYKWFGKPRIKQNSPRGDGGVGFLVRECLVNEVEFINTVKYEESVWMKIRSERGREALYIGCVYMPTDSTSISVMDSCYERLKEDVLSFREKGKVVLLGDFNARVGRSAQLDDVVGMFGENTCNASGNRLLSFLYEIEKGEITKCLRNLKNSKTGGSDGIVGELLKYGGVGMVDLLEQLFSVIWQEEIVPRQWREGLIVNIFKKGDREDPANYRGITLLSVVGKVFCKILNNRLVQCLDKEGALHEGPLSLIHSSTLAINEADELSPCLISSSHSLLSISKDLKRSSTILLHTFLCLPLRGLIFHS